MRKVNEQEARELVATIGQARGYIQNQLWSQVEASLYRLYHVENKLRDLLGEQQILRLGYHQCDVHPVLKQDQSEQWLKGKPSLCEELPVKPS